MIDSGTQKVIDYVNSVEIENRKIIEFYRQLFLKSAAEIAEYI